MKNLLITGGTTFVSRYAAEYFVDTYIGLNLLTLGVTARAVRRAANPNGYDRQ